MRVPSEFLHVCIVSLGEADLHWSFGDHLASAEQAKTFRANPERFLPAHGGVCAYGVTIGQTFPVDPTNFKIVDDRLLLFVKNEEVDARELWEKEHGQHCLTEQGGCCSC